MHPIYFSCKCQIPKSGQEIGQEILDLSRWPEFHGQGIMPGIKIAKFETRTTDNVGTRIQVINTDGSSHIEEILSWEEGKSITMRLGEFSPPLNRLADHFLEKWQFHPNDKGTLVNRSFELYAKNGFTRPFLWLIAYFLKKAISTHLDLMANDINQPPSVNA